MKAQRGERNSRTALRTEAQVFEQLGGFPRRLLVILTHLVLWTGAFWGAYFLRFEGRIPTSELQPGLLALAIVLVAQTGAFWVSGLFHGLLRYAGLPEVKSIVRATTAATAIVVIAGIVLPAARIPRSVYIGEWLLAILAASSLRLAIRMLREKQQTPRTGDGTRAIVLGAGDACDMFLRDLSRVPNGDVRVVALLDDDTRKHDSSLRGIRVVGDISERSLRRAAEDFDATLAILAMPSAPGSHVREIVELCSKLGLETKTLPSLQQLLSGQAVTTLRNVAIEDLLRREPVKLDENSIRSLVKGRRVVVTGGAGSIGSELARQVLSFEPSHLTLMDHNENALFFLERELKKRANGVQLGIVVGSIRDPQRVSEVLREARPHVVLHAAAHKHVPLMEKNPVEAVKNNVFGSRIVADLALAHGVDVFVLISTDKSVNPTSVMGATKRVAELYVQSLSHHKRTRFVAVRFGNVLGSAGSVVEVFREQIASGGPVTVTDPEMTRYFMTIPEACQLVLQAAALGRGGEIFILDMGEPVKVLDLAHDMIRMSGFQPGRDIPIEFIGVRPGEKLFEELMLDAETTDRTPHPKILVGRIPGISQESAVSAIGRLIESLDQGPDRIRSVLNDIVPEARLANGLSTRNVAEALVELQGMETLAPRAG
jgi:FlaA1/EpsC-like NDP-sugar epimerase